MVSRLARHAIVAVWSLLFHASGFAADAKPELTGKVHTYYVAADEVEWDYAPSDALT